MSTDRSLRVSEIFESVQGEGASAGEPSVFLRLAACNLRCRWCDTKYTWDWSAFRYEDEVAELSLESVVERLDRAAPGRLVITGGEPMLQQRALAALLPALAVARTVEVETNGTLAPEPPLRARVDQWNVSPKLANSGEPLARRIDPVALTALRDTGRAWLKLVVESPPDRDEAETLIRQLEWPKERVLFMAQASSRDALRERLPRVEQWARDSGVRVSPRLHVERWDGKRGV
jgi:organic radical activating enzyme